MRHRTDTERQANRRAISELYLNGWNQTEIAERLGIDQSTVSRDIKTLKAEWVKQRNGIVDEFEAKYRLIYREAILAWYKSKEDSETVIQEMIDAADIGSGSSQRLKASTRKEGQSGNPALLAQAQAALKAIREMFGLDVKNDPGSTTDNPFILKVVYGERTNHSSSESTPGTG